MLAPDGVTTRAASSYNQQVGFTGLYEDKETGLLQSLHRMYDTKLGRWISRDPWRSSNWYPSEEDGYADGYSLYAAYFIPNALDPYGLKWTLTCERCTKKDGTGGGWMYHCKLENDAAKEGDKKPDHADANDYDKYKKGGAKSGGKGNQPSDTGGDPNGSNGPLPAGNYDLIPGNSPTFGDVPGITDKGGNVPGSITTPKGTKRSVLWIHPQANLSQGCITVKNNKAFIDRIQAAIKEDGGRISLVIEDVGECKPCEECKKK